MAQTENNKFSGWLVASDIDGTLNTKLRKLPERNLNAIRHFVLDLGGHFTLASGRNVASLEKHFLRLPIKSTPAIVLNGAGLYDFEKGEMISFSAISGNGKEIVRKVIEKFPMTEIEICTPDNILLLNAFVYGTALVRADNLPHKRIKRIEEAYPYDWGKVVLFGLPPFINRVIKYANSLNNGELSCMSSSIATYELLAKGTTKGTVVKKLAGMLDIAYEHTAAIGDYFNDFDMLRSVFLPAACGQAPKKVHEIVKYHACHCNKGAVGDFLEYIEKTYA